jgi:hypothetical protein
MHLLKEEEEGHWLTSQHQIAMGIPTIVPMEGHWLTSQHQIVMSIKLWKAGVCQAMTEDVNGAWAD